jgi:hypothetical protein
MAISIAVRAGPRGVARSCSHSCSVRFEICNFNAASLWERLFHRRARRVSSATPTPSGRARHEWLFRLRFAQSRAAQLDLAPTLAAFASRFVISTPPRFARDYSARATLAVFLGTHRLRISDAERDQGVSRKPSLHAIRESRIASSPPVK